MVLALLEVCNHGAFSSPLEDAHCLVDQLAQVMEPSLWRKYTAFQEFGSMLQL